MGQRYASVCKSQIKHTTIYVKEINAPKTANKPAIVRLQLRLGEWFQHFVERLPKQALRVVFVNRLSCSRCHEGRVHRQQGSNFGPAIAVPQMG